MGTFSYLEPEYLYYYAGKLALIEQNPKYENDVYHLRETLKNYGVERVILHITLLHNKKHKDIRKYSCDL